MVPVVMKETVASVPAPAIVSAGTQVKSPDKTPATIAATVKVPLVIRPSPESRMLIAPFAAATASGGVVTPETVHVTVSPNSTLPPPTVISRVRILAVQLVLLDDIPEGEAKATGGDTEAVACLVRSSTPDRTRAPIAELTIKKRIVHTLPNKVAAGVAHRAALLLRQCRAATTAVLCSHHHAAEAVPVTLSALGLTLVTAGAPLRPI